jgi:hypothetical protein
MVFYIVNDNIYLVQCSSHTRMGRSSTSEAMWLQMHQLSHFYGSNERHSISNKLFCYVEQDKVNVKSPGISQNKIIASALGGIIAT